MTKVDLCIIWQYNFVCLELMGRAIGLTSNNTSFSLIFIIQQHKQQKINNEYAHHYKKSHQTLD